jgi:acyl carrier protein
MGPRVLQATPGLQDANIQANDWQEQIRADLSGARVRKRALAFAHSFMHHPTLHERWSCETMESQDELRTTVVRAIAASCSVEPAELRPELTVGELGLDSVAITSVLGILEAALKREFTADDVMSLFQAPSVGALVDTAVSIARAPA